ncbi:MAG: hypothetical protein ABJB55_05775 [Actinomycetota bacterium]
MIAVGWIIAAVLAAALVWLGLALAGAVRELAALRERVDALEGASSPIHLDAGLAIGSLAPVWSITAPDGSAVASSGFAGRRHLVVFADADCRACDELVPAVVRAAAAGALPPLALVGRGRPDATPEAWRGEDRTRVVAGVERASEVSDTFHVEVSPHIFVIDEGNAVVAQGGAVALGDVEALVRNAQGIRIVPGAADG